MPKIGFLFAGLCAVTLVALLYFAQSTVTQSAPKYSTWNTSPEGAKLLFDGLKQVAYVDTLRELKPIDIQKPQNSTVFYLGIDALNLDAEDSSYFDATESAASRGNDLVLAVLDDPDYSFKAQGEKTTLGKRWGIRFVSDKGDFTTDPKLDKEWKSIPGLTAVWQRDFGQGSVILVAKGQRLNNKGVATDAVNRELLYQLVSRHSSAVFDESHLGIRESGSVVGLARHYHLQGLMLGLIFLAGMFIWSRSVSFPPPPPTPAKLLLGTDSRSMLTELMSRHLKNGLMDACVNEWNRTRGTQAAIAAPVAVNALSAYRELQEKLQDKSRFQL